MSIYKFYVYAYLRSKDSITAKAGTPYYIGKGSGKRMIEDHSKLQIPPDISNIIILESNLSEIGALALERRYISWYGRKDIQTGILLNRTNGGEGVSGLKHTPETKKKLSDMGKGRKLSPETKNKMSESLYNRTPETRAKMVEGMIGHNVSDETKAKISAANKGKIRSAETRAKISEMNKNRPQELRDRIANSRRGKPWSGQRRLAHERKKSS